MKKNLFKSCFILFYICLLTSCQAEPDFTVEKEELYHYAFPSNHYYGVKNSVGNKLKGVAQRNNLWYNGTTLTVAFLNDPYDRSDFIKNTAKELEEHVNIKFDFVNSPDEAVIRIGFDWNESRWVTWSYTGSDAKSVKNKNDATVNFGSWDVLSSDMQRGDVLRAFCQVLGLELEHRHLNFDPGFSKRIQAYWQGEIEDIPWSELQEYVLTPLNQTNVIQTDGYDNQSIMVWPFDRRVAQNTARDWNLELSEKDKKFLEILYPKDTITDVLFFTQESLTGIKFEIKSKDNLIIDWGDGSQDTIKASPIKQIIRHAYHARLIRDIVIKGKTTSVTYFSIDHNDITKIDVSKCLDIDYLSVSYNPQIESLDITKNTKLTNLGFAMTSISSIDLSYCALLTHVSVEATNLSTINTDNNKKLLFLAFKGSQISSINLRNNPAVRTIVCAGTPFSKIQSNLTDLANYLPSRVGQTSGRIDFMGEEESRNILRNKNWIQREY